MRGMFRELVFLTSFMKHRLCLDICVCCTSSQWVVFVLKMHESVEVDAHTYHYCHFEYVVLIM